MTRVTAPTESPPSSRAMEAIDYTGLLDPAHLPDEQAITSSLQIVEQHLTEENCIAVVEEVLAIANPQSTAIFLSGLSSGIPVERWILNNITFDMGYYPGSVALRLLSSISTFVVDLPLTEHHEIALELAEHYREVQAGFLAMPALISFCSRTQSLGESVTVLSAMELIQEDNGLHDAVPFLAALGIPIPTHPIEAESALLQVIEQQKHLLSFYLSVIRLPEVRSEIMTRFISELNEAHGVEVSQLDERRSVPSILKQSYYEAIHSFGMWKILISGRTDEDLRRWRRGDKEIFLDIVRKIRDLSRGDFSPNNQSRINGSGDNVVPIFEAKVASDYYLIYQVDCLQETVTEEKQAVKIYGIYSSTECKREFWDVVGKQLASKGKVYKDRCRYRVPLDRNSEQRYFIPAVFPPMTKKPVEEFSIADVLQDVQDREWLQTISVLQKFVPLSQALLHSIFADLEAMFPVDVSLEEKVIIEHPSSCYVLGRSGTGKTTTMLYKMLQIERGFQNNSGGSTRIRQIFITKSGILAEKVQEHFNTMLDSLEISNMSPEELKEVALSRGHKPCDDLVDKDEDSDLHAPTLPEKFSDLQDKHFPLFLTFDRLCKLLAADLVGATDSSLHPNRQALNDPGLEKEKFVSYDRFRGRHWRRHNQKGLDPYSVFNELLGVIEGSELAASSPQKCIDANTYESLSGRGYPTFSTKRGIIYDIFQSYRKMKREMGEYDAADRTHALLHSIEIDGVPGQKFDYIYIDEAQDNLMIDALLLRVLCRNPDGLFWAGDTAQTISSGCSFRFQDLKSMLYRVEHQVEEIDLESSSKLPKTFPLTVNYRSHSGIVNCAHSVVELIQQFWPYSIDILAPEQGFFVGPLPVILAMSHSDNIQFKQSHLGSRRESLEFGANQCIIVRNKEVKEQLKKHVGGNVLTIHESKGLEFNDVLLYNVFEDSTLEFAQWRLILKQELWRFDALKYIGLCTELKSLYVAITRAKKNLWIADCSEKAKPMKDYWLKRNLVHIRTIAEEDLLRLAETSTAEEWFDMGMLYFERKQYSEARNCFERASRPRERAIAHAYALREQASMLPTGKSAEVARRHAFLEAAEAFRSCSSKHNPVYSRRSGECFEAAEQYPQAAKAFYQGENYTQSVILYRRLGKFDEAIPIVLERKDNVQQDVVDGVKDAAKLFYLSRAETDESALGKAKQLFDTDDELLKYLDDMCLDGVRGTVLSSLGKYPEAIESFVTAGRYLDAIKLLLKDRNPDSTRQAYTYIVQELWKLMPFGFRAGNVKSDNITNFLTLSDGLEGSFIQFNERAEIEMFHEIYSNNHSALRRLGEKFFDARNFPASAHCFEQIYHERLPNFEAMTLPEIAESLRIFRMYVQAMFAIAIQTDPRDSYAASRLFGYEIRKRNRFFLPKGTFFYTATEEHGFNPSRRMDGGFLINGETLGALYRRALEAHLKNLLLKENELCLHSPALSDVIPCINFLVHGDCRKPKGSCTWAHLRPSNFDSSWYNLRINVHLIQISILQTLASLLDYQELNKLRRIWISQLYEALHPPLYLLGSFALFNPLLIPEYHRYLHLLKEWIRELAYNQSSHPSQLKFFITNLLKSLDLSLTFDKDESCNYLYRAKFMKFPPISDHLRPPHGTYIVFEAINSLRDESRWLSSLTQGILFSKHVVDKCLPVDMGVLCNYLDFLCGQSVISASMQRHGVLHEVLLPRSWWIKLMIRPGCNANKSTRLSRLLVDVISSLLSQLLGNNKAEHLLHHSRAVKPESWQTTICWTYITRLCRAVCLLGHNLGWSWLKQSILTIFNRLSSLVDHISPLCSMYFRSHYWLGIVVALHAGSHDLAREQLILVCNRHKVASARDVQQERCYRRLYYTDKCDLLAALQSNLHNGEKAQVKGNIADNTVEAKDDRPDPQGSTYENIQMDDIEEELQEHYDSSKNRPSMQAASLTDEEQEAGNIIRNAYRKYARGKAMSLNSSARLTRSAFIECLEQSRTVEWPRRSQYKLLYLGPLPNLLACLEYVWADISDKRDDARKMLGKKLGHDALDQENAKLTELLAHKEETQRLREALAPKGNIHPFRDQAKLKSTVQEAVTFIRKFPNVAMGEMRWDLEAAEKGILKEKEKKAKGRPELQVEAELAYDDGDDDLY